MTAERKTFVGRVRAAKTVLLQTKMDPADAKLVGVAANARGVSVSQLMRDAIIAYIGRPGQSSMFEQVRFVERRHLELEKRVGRVEAIMIAAGAMESP